MPQQVRTLNDLKMTRYVQSTAKKGSQKWIQKLVNEKPELLDSEIKKRLRLPKDENIEWLSPLKRDKYAEYRDETYVEKLKINLVKVPLAKFWPRNGPQWDALGRSSSGRLFLVEAKSHIPELISTLKARNKDSRNKILRSLRETKLYMNAKGEVDWAQGFYQYTNRLAHLYLLRINRLPAYLVFIYFVNDRQMKGPRTASEWKGAIKLLHSCLGIGRHRLQPYTADIFIDARTLE